MKGGWVDHVDVGFGYAWKAGSASLVLGVYRRRLVGFIDMRAWMRFRLTSRRTSVVGAVSMLACLLSFAVHNARAAPRPPPPAGVHQLAPGQLPTVCSGADVGSGDSSVSGVYYDSPSNSWLSAPYCYQLWGNLAASPPQLAEAGKPMTVSAIPNQGSNSATYAPQTMSISWSVGVKPVSGCGAADLTCTFIPAPQRTHAWQWIEVEVSMPRTFFIDSPGSNCAGQHLCAGFETHAWTWIGVPPDFCEGRQASSDVSGSHSGPTATVADSRSAASKSFLHCIALYSGVDAASWGFMGVVMDVFQVPIKAGLIAAAQPELAAAVVPAAKASQVIAGGFTVLGATLEAMSNDPPDPHYMQVARPSIVSPAPVSLTGPVGRVVAPALDAVMRQQARLIAFSRALELARNRAGGAHRAHSQAWERRQMLAVSRYSAGLATTIDLSLRAIANLAAAIRPTVLGTTPFTPANAEQARSYVAQHGLPAELVATLKGLGVSSASISKLAKSTVKGNANLAPRSLDAAFNDPRTAAAYRRFATTLRSYARRVAANPSVNQT